MGFLVSDCSVGKIESQVGKFDVQVGIEIFLVYERRMSPTVKSFGYSQNK
jgi:hypothetical protein